MEGGSGSGAGSEEGAASDSGKVSASSDGCDESSEGCVESSAACSGSDSEEGEVSGSEGGDGEVSSPSKHSSCPVSGLTQKFPQLAWAVPRKGTRELRNPVATTVERSVKRMMLIPDFQSLDITELFTTCTESKHLIMEVHKNYISGRKGIESTKQPDHEVTIRYK